MVWIDCLVHCKGPHLAGYRSLDLFAPAEGTIACLQSDVHSLANYSAKHVALINSDVFQKLGQLVSNVVHMHTLQCLSALGPCE
jgi:hypothetical protein